jgi:hypothetical protein
MMTYSREACVQPACDVIRVFSRDVKWRPASLGIAESQFWNSRVSVGSGGGGSVSAASPAGVPSIVGPKLAITDGGTVAQCGTVTPEDGSVTWTGGSLFVDNPNRAASAVRSARFGSLCTRVDEREIAMVYRDNIDGYGGDVWTIPARRMKNLAGAGDDNGSACDVERRKMRYHSSRAP